MSHHITLNIRADETAAEHYLANVAHDATADGLAYTIEDAILHRYGISTTIGLVYDSTEDPAVVS